MLFLTKILFLYFEKIAMCSLGYKITCILMQCGAHKAVF
jgi:hypothetical protein